MCFMRKFSHLCAGFVKRKLWYVSKAVSLFYLHEMLGVSDITSFTIRSPANIRSMIIVLSDIINEELVKKIKESKGYACLIDEATDILNVQNLLTFIIFYILRRKEWLCQSLLTYVIF